MITPKRKATPIVVRKTLCTACVFSHVVRGHEERILCGYAFPPRESLFAVRECTDPRVERESTLALAVWPKTETRYVEKQTGSASRCRDALPFQWSRASR